MSIQGFETINAANLLELVDQKNRGRFATIPYAVLLHALGNSFQFFIDYRHAILETTLAVLIAVKHHHFDSSPRMRQVEEVLSSVSIPEPLHALGVSEWCIERRSVYVSDFYGEVRSNRYLLYLYQVMMGSFLIIIGSLGLRRQSEILDLDPLYCLDPPIDPYLPNNASINYCLSYSARKTGTRNQHQVLSVGITQPLAKFIWDLMEFRRKCNLAGVLSDRARLLLWVDQRKVTAGSIKIFHSIRPWIWLAIISKCRLWRLMVLKGVIICANTNYVDLLPWLSITHQKETLRRFVIGLATQTLSMCIRTFLKLHLDWFLIL